MKKKKKENVKLGWMHETKVFQSEHVSGKYLNHAGDKLMHADIADRDSVMLTFPYCKILTT